MLGGSIRTHIFNEFTRRVLDVKRRHAVTVWQTNEMNCRGAEVRSVTHTHRQNVRRT